MNEETVVDLAEKIQAKAGAKNLHVTADAALIAASNLFVARAGEAAAQTGPNDKKGK